MRCLESVARLALLFPAAALAGPPFLTDDPEPTETGHWEIYAPLLDAEGRGGELDGQLGAELNYGAARNLQLSLGLPASVTHEAGRWHWGTADVDLSAKYRIHDGGASGLQVAVFPRLTLPTAGHRTGAGHVTALLPLWLQKDIGDWAIFGGGGYALNPGEGRRNYVTTGLAVTRRLGEPLLLGVELDHRGRDAADGPGSTSFGLGGIYDLRGALRLLASAGPTWDSGGATRFHVYVALGVDL